MLRQVLHEKLQTGALLRREALAAHSPCSIPSSLNHSCVLVSLHWDLPVRKNTASCCFARSCWGPPPKRTRACVLLLLLQRRGVSSPLKHSLPKRLGWLHHWRLRLRQLPLVSDATCLADLPIFREHRTFLLGSKRLEGRNLSKLERL